MMRTMKFRKAIPPLVVLIFAIAISVTSSPRFAGDVNEPAYETVCDSAYVLDTITPGLLAQGSSMCDSDDEKAVFKSAVSYFLEKYENSPPC